MTNYIASELTDRHSRDVDRKEMVDFVRGYSDKELIESAQSYNASNIGDRIRESLLPTFRTQERDIARNILSERYKSMSNGKLIDCAAGLKYSNGFNKIDKILLSSPFRDAERQGAIKVLEDRGVDWKTRRVERYEARKRASNWKWNKFKRELIAPFANLYNHVINSYSEIHNVENKMWRAAFASEPVKINKRKLK